VRAWYLSAADLIEGRAVLAAVKMLWGGSGKTYPSLH
jgi:hypothetical protein